MKVFKIILVALTLFFVSAPSFAKKKDKGMYLFGVATSLTDSVVYVTDIQFFEDTDLSEVDFSKTVSRYSIQLQNYVSVMMSTEFQTAATFFSKKKKVVEKDRKKVLNKFIKKNKMLKVNVPTKEFEFKYIPLVTEEEDQAAM